MNPTSCMLTIADGAPAPQLYPWYRSADFLLSACFPLLLCSCVLHAPPFYLLLNSACTSILRPPQLYVHLQTVLLQHQSGEEFMAKLQDPGTVVVVSVSHQSRAALAGGCAVGNGWCWSVCRTIQAVPEGEGANRDLPPKPFDHLNVDLHDSSASCA